MAVGVVVTLAIGAGAFFNGYYELSKWGLLSIGALVVLMVTLLTRTSTPPLRALIPAFGLACLAAVEFLSATWAESVDRALLEGHRTLLYAVLAVLLAAIAQRKAGRTGLMAGVALTGGALAAYTSVQLVSGDISGLFLRGRLEEPLGYQNAMAGALLLSAWPLVGLAEAGRSRVVAGLSAAGASYLVLLAALSQSRGATFALIGSAGLMIVLLPGWTIRAPLIALLAASAVTAWPALAEVSASQSPQSGIPTDDSAAHALVIALIVAASTGVAWAMLRPLVSSITGACRGIRASWRRAGWIATGGCVLATAVLTGPSAVEKVDQGWQEFTRLAPVQSGSRFASGGGKRYDLWRVAVDQFADAPFGGIGAGNYYKTYFVERRSTEDVRQAHSIELQVAGETGLLGLAALGLFLAGIVMAAARARPVARKSGSERALLVGATGTVLYWLLHTSVDWMHLLPSLTGLALAGVAVVGGAAAWPSPALPRRNPWTPLAFAAATLAAASLGIAVLADHYRGEARDALDGKPQEAAARAEEAIQLNDRSVDGYVLLAAAQARQNRYEDARATLIAATRREPSNFVPWTLLGDLATRRGERADARGFYRRALALNPRDPSLRAIARLPPAEK